MDAQPKSPDALVEHRVALLEQLFAHKAAALRRQARRNSPSQSDGEDALQDAAVQFLRFYDGEASDALPWLLLVVKRCAWKVGERARRLGAHEHVVTVDPSTEAEQEIVAVEERSGPLELIERSEALARKVELLDQLKPDERTALILIGLGATYREIAELRGWSLRKVERCALEGRARLKALVGRGVE